MDKIILAIFGTIGMLMLSGVAIAEFEQDLFWSRIDNTIVLTDSSHNVSVGANETTTYKLFVNGTLRVNDITTIDGIFIANSNIFCLDDMYGASDMVLTGDVVATNARISVDAIVEADIYAKDDILLGDIMYHYQDTDTYISFAYDTILISAGGLRFLSMYEYYSAVDKMVFNDYQQNIDFYLESDYNNEVLFMDASMSMVNFNGGLSYDVETKDRDFQLYEREYLYLVNCSTGIIEIAIPKPDVEGQQFIIKDLGGDADTNTIYLNSTGTHKIDDLFSQVIDWNYGCITLTSDKTNWYITGKV